MVKIIEKFKKFCENMVKNSDYELYMLLVKLLLHISVHLTVMRFTMKLHSKISTCHLNKIRNSKSVDPRGYHYSDF